MYSEIASYDIERFVVPLWAGVLKGLEKAFLPSHSSSFLKNPLIMYTMHPTGSDRRLTEKMAVLDEAFSREELAYLCQEDDIGKPLLQDLGWTLTSQNTINCLYCIARFTTKTGVDCRRVNNIIEWGGGYGMLAKIMHRLKEDTTYTIIDLPLLSCLQWIYLSSIFGEDSVNLVRTPRDPILDRRINLVSLPFLDTLNTMSPDLFVSTFALSESSQYAQEFVVSRNWFNAKHLLLAYLSETFDKLTQGMLIENIPPPKPCRFAYR